eukprot:4571448-Lingulodinium_polyedra.AAC.1
MECADCEMLCAVSVECDAMACDRASFCSRSVDLRMNLASGAIAQCIAKRVRSGSRSLICDRPFDLACNRQEPRSPWRSHRHCMATAWP